MDSDKDSDDKKDFKQNLCGYMYQLKILLLFLWRGKYCKKFQLGTELEDAEKFDDAIFSYETNGETYIRYVQAKYSRFDGGKLKYSDFVSDFDRAKCNLKKYFISYQKIKQRKGLKKIDSLILCTNYEMPVTLRKNPSNWLTFVDVSVLPNFKDDIFYDSNTKKGWKKYQLQDVNTCKDLTNKLQGCSNLNLLANEFAIYLFKDDNSANLDFKNYWISAYFNVLMEENIIKMQVYRFASENPNPQTAEQEQRNKDIKELKDHYITEMKNRKGVILNANQLLNVKFEKEFIDKLKQRNGSTDLKKVAETLVKCDCTNAAPTFDKLNNVFVLKQKEYVFSDDFIDGINLSINGNNFRSILLQNCEKVLAKHFEKFTFFEVDALNKISQYSSSAFESFNTTMKEMSLKLINHLFHNGGISDIFRPEHSFLNNVFQLTGTNSFKFTTDFVKNTDPYLQQFRSIFLEEFAKEKLKMKILKFKQDLSKLSELVGQLKTAFDTAQNSKTNVVKLENTKTYDGSMRALNGSVFEATEERNKIKMKDLLFNTNQTFSNNLANEFKKQLDKTFKPAQINSLKNFEIEYSNYPPYFDKLEENGEINKDIEEFRMLLFIVKTPNETDLTENVALELGEEFNLLDPSLLTHGFFQKVLNWAKESEEILLNRDNIIKLIDDLRVIISKNLVFGCNVEYCYKLAEYNIEYSQNLEKFLTFLTNQEAQILHLTTDEILLTTVKVAQTLKLTKFWQNKDSFIFNPLTSLLRMEYSKAKNGQIEKYVSKSFSSTANLLIIVDKKSIKDFNQFCKTLSQILCNNSEKKIVIIGNENSPTASALKTAQTDVQYDVFLDKTNFNDLTIDSQLNIQKYTTITFQGKNVSMIDLINSNESASELIDSETLLQMVRGEKIVNGDPVKNFTGTEENYYHQRKFRLIEIDCKVFKENSLKQNTMFFIEGINVLEYLNKYEINESEIKDYKTSSADCRFIIVNSNDAKVHFGSVCKNYPKSFIHWLKLEKETLIWFHSYTPPSVCLSQEFVKHVTRNDTYVDESFFYEYVKQNQIVIVSDIAGMGKTTVLKSFSKTLNDTNYWKIRINLNQYTDTLLEIKKYIKNHNLSIENTLEEISGLHLNFTTFDGTDYGKLVLNSLINSETPDLKKLSFENRIFNHFFTKKKMLFMFDGFDEINPDYGEEVMALLQKLKKDEKNRIWITSRINDKKMLENKLNTFAYDLKPFDEEDQKAFLSKFWLNNWKMEKGNDMPNQDRLSFYIAVLLEEASKIIGNIIGIPLQTKMLAEIFQENLENTKTWISCFHFVENNKISKNIHFSAKLGNVFMLYENFFEEKILKYFLHDKQIVDLSKPSAKEFKNYCLSMKNETHKFYGFVALCDKKKFIDLISTKENETQYHFRDGIEKIGIIDYFNDDNHPLFTHLTYAEYFCACFLVDKLCTLHFPAQKVFEAINEIFKKDVPVFNKCLLYRMKQEINNKEFQNKLNGKSILKFVIQQELFNCVVVFLRNKDFSDGVFYSDEPKKYILHFAAEFGSFDIFIYTFLFVVEGGKIMSDHEIDVFSNFFHYMFESNEYMFANTNCTKISLFLKDASIVSENYFKRRKTQEPNTEFSCFLKQFLKPIYVFKNHQRKIHIPTYFFKYFSFESILNIINTFKHKEDMFLQTETLEEICIRNNFTMKEKLKIFHLMIDDKQEDVYFIESLLNIIVKTESCDLFREVLKEDTFKITYQIQISLLKTAVIYNSYEIVRFLFELFENDESSNIKQLIDIALKENVNLKMFKLLIEKTKMSLNSALITAIKNRYNIKKINYLIENGAELFKENERNESPWKLAVEKANDEIIKYFLLTIDAAKNDIFYKRIDNLGLKIMIKIVKEYFEDPLNFKFKQYLFQAIDDKDNVLCHFLLRKNANVNIMISDITDKNGNSPLYLAWKNDMSEVVRHLLFYGATYNAKDLLGNNKISIDENIQKYTNDKEQTLWHIAAKSSDFKNIDNLISESVIDNQDINGNTALHFAVQFGKGYSVREILKRSACYNIKNNEGKSPNDLVNDNEVITYSFKSILDAFRRAEINNFDLMILYKIYGIINVKNESGRTLLHYAVLNENITAVNELLSNGADITIGDDENRTPLYYAVKDDSYSIVKTITVDLSKRHPTEFEENYIFGRDGKLFNDEKYKDIPQNKCTILLSRINKCLNHVFNEEIEELITLLDLIEDTEEFNIIVNINEFPKMSVANFAVNNYDLAKYLFQKDINIYYYNTDFQNLRIQKALGALQQVAQIIFSKECEPQSVINYCNNILKKRICALLCINDELIANKIIANVCGDSSATHCQ